MKTYLISTLLAFLLLFIGKDSNFVKSQTTVSVSSKEKVQVPDMKLNDSLLNNIKKDCQVTKSNLKKINKEIVNLKQKNNQEEIVTLIDTVQVIKKKKTFWQKLFNRNKK